MSAESFQKYVGEKISVSERTITRSYPKLGLDDYDEVIATVDQKDKTMIQILKEAKDLNLYVRTWLPQTVGTMELRNNRLNIHIDKKDANYEITSVSIG